MVYLLTKCIYVNSLIDGPLKITFVGDMVNINKLSIYYYTNLYCCHATKVN